MARDSTVDDYLARLPVDQRNALEAVRAQVRSMVPDAVESISYGIPAFKLRGRPLLYFAGWKIHCSVYPLAEGFLEANAEALKGYTRTKGSLHFTPQHPLTPVLLESLVRARLRELST